MTQQILVMYFLKGKKVGEIAKELNTFQSTVSEVIGKFLKPSSERFIIVESKMNSGEV
jgi:DNA-directed RNA polymerase specialized sigma subunit